MDTKLQQYREEYTLTGKYKTMIPEKSYRITAQEVNNINPDVTKKEEIQTSTLYNVIRIIARIRTNKTYYLGKNIKLTDEQIRMLTEDGFIIKYTATGTEIHW